MSFHPREISFEIATDPASAKKRIAKLIEKHDGDLYAVADDLGVTYRTLHRYLTKLEIRPRLERVRKRVRRHRVEERAEA